MSETKTSKWSGGRIILIIIVALPLLLVIGREIAWGQTLGYFRLVDLADLFILAPLYTAILLYLWFRMQSYNAPRWLLVFFIVFIIVFLYGHAIHFTGNSLNTYITEVNDFKDQTIRTFLDENKWVTYPLMMVVFVVFSLILGRLDTKLGLRKEEMRNAATENPVTMEMLNDLKEIKAKLDERA